MLMFILFLFKEWELPDSEQTGLCNLIQVFCEMVSYHDVTIIKSPIKHKRAETSDP